MLGQVQDKRGGIESSNRDNNRHYRSKRPGLEDRHPSRRSKLNASDICTHQPTSPFASSSGIPASTNPLSARALLTTSAAASLSWRIVTGASRTRSSSAEISKPKGSTVVDRNCRFASRSPGPAAPLPGINAHGIPAAAPTSCSKMLYNSTADVGASKPILSARQSLCGAVPCPSPWPPFGCFWQGYAALRRIRDCGLEPVDCRFACALW